MPYRRRSERARLVTLYNRVKVLVQLLRSMARMSSRRFCAT
jgi:hypothetical protein